MLVVQNVGFHGSEIVALCPCGYVHSSLGPGKLPAHPERQEETGRGTADDDLADEPLGKRGVPDVAGRVHCESEKGPSVAGSMWA